MALSAFVGPLAWAIGDGTALASSASQTSLLLGAAGTGKWGMPANYFTAPGQTLRIRASGRMSNTATPTIIFSVVIGAVNVAVSPTWTTLSGLAATTTWYLDWLLTLRAAGDGTLANFMHTGQLVGAITSATVWNNMIPATAPVVGTGFPSNAAATLDLQATWSASSASNTITLHQYMLESVL
jgi:hypothetical protein